MDSFEDGSGLFALVIPTANHGVHNQIVAFVNVGGNWKLYLTTLKDSSFNYMQFLKKSSDMFVYAGFDNSQYNI